jgi:hypothetical protein
VTANGMWQSTSGSPERISQVSRNAGRMVTYTCARSWWDALSRRMVFSCTGMHMVIQIAQQPPLCEDSSSRLHYVWISREP